MCIRRLVSAIQTLFVLLYTKLRKKNLSNGNASLNTDIMATRTRGKEQTSGRILYPLLIDLNFWNVFPSYFIYLFFYLNTPEQ
jgi:hypothetical protein